MFRKSDYIPFALGIFTFGGLFLVPLLWSKFNNIDFTYAVFPSLISCLVFFVAHDNKGNFSISRFIMGVVVIYFSLARTALQSGSSSQPMFIAGGFVGYIVMFACGWGGIMLGRLIRGPDQIKKEELEENEARLKKNQTKVPIQAPTPQCVLPADNTPFNHFLSSTYNSWRVGKLDLLSELFKKEATQNSFAKFCEEHEKYRSDFEVANSIRPVEDGEYLVSLTKNCFLMTSRAVYFFTPEKRVFLLTEFLDYKLGGFFTINLDATLKSGEKLVFPKMKAAPAEKFVFAFRDGKIS